jgi:hypothetical protein
MAAVSSAMNGHTVRLGALLASAGISTIVVMNSAAPELAGVQNVPLRSAPGVLATALNDQSDLSLVLQTSSVEVFSNSLFHGIVASSAPGSRTLTPLFSTTSNSGLLTPGSTVVAGLAPAGAFALTANGQPTARSTHHTWTPFYRVPTSPATLQGALVLHQFPLNGIVALFTLAMWALVWLGFGWIHRLEWLFTGRRRRARTRGERVRDE